jgi:deoxycytidine triphosphate deaminase
MSVIPFVLDGPNKSVTALPEEFSPVGTILLVCPIKSDLTIENACLDLHVGKLYRSHRGDDVSWNTDANPVIVIRPKSLVSIQTQESVSFPTCRFGYVMSKVDLLERGLTNAASKIDPGYSGHLLVTVFNLGPNTIHLRAGDPFCTLVVHELGPGGVTYKKGPKGWHGVDHPLAFKDRLHDWIDRNSGVLSLLGPLIATCALLTPLILHKFIFGTWLSR